MKVSKEHIRQIIKEELNSLTPSREEISSQIKNMVHAHWKETNDSKKRFASDLSAFLVGKIVNLGQKGSVTIIEVNPSLSYGYSGREGPEVTAVCRDAAGETFTAVLWREGY